MKAKQKGDKKMIKKLTQDECFSFLLDDDNKEVYPNIYAMIKHYMDEDEAGRSQYMIEHSKEHPDYESSIL